MTLIYLERQEPDFDLVEVDFDPFADEELAKRASSFLRRLDSLGGDKPGYDRKPGPLPLASR